MHHKFGHFVQTEELRREEGRLVFPRPQFRGAGQEAGLAGSVHATPAGGEAPGVPGRQEGGLLAMSHSAISGRGVSWGECSKNLSLFLNLDEQEKTSVKVAFGAKATLRFG